MTNQKHTSLLSPLLLSALFKDKDLDTITIYEVQQAAAAELVKELASFLEVTESEEGDDVEDWKINALPDLINVLKLAGIYDEEYAEWATLGKIAALEAEISQLREALSKSHAALKRVTDERSTSYQARNGKWVSIQGDDGERCDIIHSDITTDCEAAVEALKGGAA